MTIKSHIASTHVEAMLNNFMEAILQLVFQFTKKLSPINIAMKMVAGIAEKHFAPDPSNGGLGHCFPIQPSGRSGSRSSIPVTTSKYSSIVGTQHVSCR